MNFSPEDYIYSLLQSSSIFESNSTIAFDLFDFDELSKSISASSLTTCNFPNPKLVLGKQIEHYFELLLKSSPKYRLVCSNLQIIDDKRTIGELDYIVHHSPSDQYIHIELVYKFYIYDPSFEIEIDRWIGPNRKDTFVEKTSKLQQKQLPLLYHSQTKKILQETYAVTISDCKQQVCYLAQLFIPFEFSNHHSFSLINQKAIVGRWIAYSKFKTLPWNQIKFHLPDKKQWTLTPTSTINWLSKEEILAEIDILMDLKKSPMVWYQTHKGTFHKLCIVWW